MMMMIIIIIIIIIIIFFKSFFKEFPSFGAATLNAWSANETVFVLGTFSEQLIRGS